MIVARVVCAALFLIFLGMFHDGLRDWAGPLIALALFTVIFLPGDKPQPVSTHYDLPAEQPTQKEH